MIFKIYDMGGGSTGIQLTPVNDAEREMLTAIRQMRLKSVSGYAEVDDSIYGATAGRTDGQVLVGPDGEHPAVIINFFADSKPTKPAQQQQWEIPGYEE